MKAKNPDRFEFHQDSWIQLEPIDFYRIVTEDLMIEDTEGVETIFTELGTLNYYYNSVSMKAILCADSNPNSLWKLKRIKKEELAEQFKFVLRKDKLMRIKEKI